MQFVSHENLSAARWECAVTGRATDPDGFFDCRRDLVLLGTDNQRHVQEIRATISAAAVHEMARQRGWVSPDEVAELVARVDAMEDETRDLHKKLEDLTEYKRLEKELVA